jgi:hypothetical protein
MNQYTYDDVQQMTYAQLGAIDDAMLLTSTGHVSPMLVRYIVRTGQLEKRYPGVLITTLLGAIDNAAAEAMEWPFSASQLSTLGIQHEQVDAYLNALGTYESMRFIAAR